MKKLFYLLVLLSMIVFTNCQNYEELNLSQTPDAHLAIIKALKLDETTVIDKGAYYLVEGDIGLEKKHLKNYLDNATNSEYEVKQGYKPKNLVSLVNVKNITVRIDDAVPTSGSGKQWRDATPLAIKAWNEIPGSCIKFILTTSLTANLTIKRTYDSNNSAIAWTWLPVNSKPPTELYVNEYYNEILSYSYKINTLIHEFGHAIGLLHSHETPDSQGGIVVPGTPQTDSYSIMSYSRIRDAYPGFSGNDLIAIRYLYPNIEKLTASNLYPRSGETVTYMLPEFGGSITWQGIENATLISGQGTSRATFMTSGNGAVKIKGVAYYSGSPYEIDVPYVWAGPPQAASSTNPDIPNIIKNENTVTVLSQINGVQTRKWSVIKGRDKMVRLDMTNEASEATFWPGSITPPDIYNLYIFEVEGSNPNGTVKRRIIYQKVP